MPDVRHPSLMQGICGGGLLMNLSAFEANRLPWRPALLFLCCVAYVFRFYEAWSWPSIDGYPAIERFLDSSYLLNDFYTNTSDSFGPDTILAVIFGGLQKITGIPYQDLIAIANLLRCASFVVILYFFLRAFTGSRDIALIGTVLGTLSGFMMPNTPGWQWISGRAEPGNFAVTIILAAWFFALGRRLWVSNLLLTASLLFHPVIGFYGALFTALIFITDFASRERLAGLNSWKTIASALLFGSVFLFLYANMAGNVTEKLPSGEYIEILAFERHPHHFVPSRFNKTIWIFFCLFMAGFAAILWLMWREVPRRRLVTVTLAAYGAFAVLGYIFIEVYPLKLVAQLIPYRFCIVLAPVILAVMSTFLFLQLQKRNFLTALLLAIVYVTAPERSQAYAELFTPLATFSLFALSVISDQVRSLTPSRSVSFLAAQVMNRGALPALAAGALLMMLVRNTPPETSIPTLGTSHPVYGWMLENTPEDSIFLLAQAKPYSSRDEILSPQKVRLIGRRAVVASQDFPFREDHFREWRWRWRAVNAWDPSHTDRLTEDEIIRLAGEFHFDYVIRTIPLDAPMRLREAARIADKSGHFSVYIYRIPNGPEVSDQAGDK
jgi:hypothetical protein